MTITYSYNTILLELVILGGVIIKLAEEFAEALNERPIRLFLALLAIIAILSVLTNIYICIALAIILFTGGLLLIFSIEPREYNNAAWMNGIAFALLLGSIEGLKTLEISFLSATSMLTWTASAFILLAIFEEDNVLNKFIYATLAFVFIVIRILSQ